MASISNGLTLISNLAVAIGEVFTTVNTILTVIDILNLITDLGLGGALKQMLRDAWERQYAQLRNSPEAEVKKLFTSELWLESAESFGRNTVKIFDALTGGGKGTGVAKALVRELSIFSTGFPRLVIQLPVPYGFPIPVEILVPLPVNCTFRKNL